MKNSWIQTFRRLAAATVVAGSTMYYSAMCYASAFDVATNPAYADGWQAGDNGGTGFGAWSFNGTDPTPAGTYQAMSSSSPIGTSWTLSTHANNTGLANAGRAITGGLLPGETFSTTIDNPTAYHFFRGFDISFTSGPDNNAGGNNTAALRASVFNYFSTTWGINDAGGNSSSGINQATVAVAGMRLDLTLTSATTYSLTMTPLNGATPYTKAGTLAGGPITWVDYRLYDGTSAGPEDTANNFEISRMSITPEPATFTLFVLGAAGVAAVGTRRKR
jgi:hypothetical protein